MESSDALMARFLALHPKVIDLSLTRIERLLEALGRPQDRLPPTIHVAGTNGKGSTIAFCRAMLEAAGLSVHVYTSPHLVRFHERIRIGVAGGAQAGGGRYIDEPALIDALRRCEAVNGGAPITVFEITTAAALLLFSERPADVLLLEVGLGGRFDATNVIDRPACSVITSIGMDHAEYLGDTIGKIAGEKAGIMKPGCPVVIAQQDYPEAEDVLRAEAQRRRATPVLVGGEAFQAREERGRLVYEDEERLMDLPLPRLAGRHQHINAGCAMAALRAAGFGHLPVTAIEQGLTQAEWPARLQLLTRGRLPTILPPGSELWLDGGHNPDGGRVLAAAMAEREEIASAPLVLVAGMLGTKDSEGFLRNFAGLAYALIAVPVQGQMAGRPPEDVAAIATKLGIPASISYGADAALAEIAARPWDRAPRVLICGSLYMAGDVLAANGTPPV